MPSVGKDMEQPELTYGESVCSDSHYAKLCC